MAKEITVKVGRELSAAEAKKVDRNKMAVLHPMPPKAGVEGQYPVYEVVQCPACGAIGYAWIDTEIYVAVYCGSCPAVFQA